MLSVNRRYIILITGVTQGLGRAMVNELAGLGHLVCGCGRTKNELDRLGRTHPTHDFRMVDVASDVEVRAWAALLLNQYGPPDFLINNAATISPKVSFWKIDDSTFTKAIDTNIRGIANVIRHFSPSMIERKSGVIVNFISRWGTKYETKMATYCATKWAVVALTRVLAEELRYSGVTACGLNPGIINTRMLQRYLGPNSIHAPSSYPSPSEWAKLAVPLILRTGMKHTGKMLAIKTNRFTSNRNTFNGELK